jgi:phospholipid/cholesterol/gamma-HCH transport system permease protein
MALADDAANALRIHHVTKFRMTAKPHPPPSAAWKQDGEDLTLELAGDWERDGPEVKASGKPLEGRLPTRYSVNQLGAYDSSLPAFLFAHFRSIASSEKGKKEQPTLDGLPAKLRGLLALALAVPEESETSLPTDGDSVLGKLGLMTLSYFDKLQSFLEFAGLTVLSVARFCVGRARFRTSDFWMVLQQCGADALPIVALISFLIGLILAFVGNVQLTHFGANLYVADLVGIAMVREMGVVMTAIIMSGRTGAAFAAHIGSMKANEEIDALRTFGFNPFDFLVLPRLLALVLMMPLLTIYADVIGILGGMLVGSFVGIPPELYWNETLASLDMTNSSLGVIKSVFFGATIAMSGCMMGMQAGKSSAAVGEATTQAVVASITAIVVLDSAFAAIFTLLDI